MKRKFLLTLITALCLIFTCMAFACDKEQTDDAGWYDPTETVKTIYFADASYSVDRYSVITLNPNYTGDSTVEWLSSDTSVAMVIDGQVLGVSAGTATVTASAASLPFEDVEASAWYYGAVDSAYAAAKKIHFDGAHMRSDIGSRDC